MKVNNGNQVQIATQKKPASTGQFGVSSCLIGIPGSGKTVSLVERIAELMGSENSSSGRIRRHA
jgi:superfamily I DNA/RNA helicase